MALTLLAALSICRGGGCDKPGLYLATPLILFMDARDLLASHRGHLSHCDWGLVGRCWGVCLIPYRVVGYTEDSRYFPVIRGQEEGSTDKKVGKDG